MKCPFCDTSQSYRFIVETETMRALYPKAPAGKYHVLLTPKRHVEHFDLLNPKEMADMLLLVQKLVAAVKSNAPDFIGYNVLSNNGGPAVRQHVMHSHTHLFLRLDGEPNPLIGTDSDTPPDLSSQELESLKELKSWFS